MAESNGRVFRIRQRAQCLQELLVRMEGVGILRRGTEQWGKSFHGQGGSRDHQAWRRGTRSPGPWGDSAGPEEKDIPAGALLEIKDRVSGQAGALTRMDQREPGVLSAAVKVSLGHRPDAETFRDLAG